MKPSLHSTSKNNFEWFIVRNYLKLVYIDISVYKTLSLLQDNGSFWATWWHVIYCWSIQRLDCSIKNKQFQFRLVVWYVRSRWPRVLTLHRLSWLRIRAMSVSLRWLSRSLMVEYQVEDLLMPVWQVENLSLCICIKVYSGNFAWVHVCLLENVLLKPDHNLTSVELVTKALNL